MDSWEYLIVALPQFEAPSGSPAQSPAVQALNDEGARGWEAVGMTVLADASVAVLFKKPLRTGRDTTDQGLLRRLRTDRGQATWGRHARQRVPE